MQLLTAHPNHHKKNFTFFSFSIRKEKTQSLPIKEREAKFNANDLIFRKKFNLPSGALLSAECSSAEYKSPESLESLINKYKLFGTKSKQTVNFSNIPKKPFPLTPSKKYIMIKEFKCGIEGIKNILNEIKKKQNN